MKCTSIQFCKLTDLSSCGDSFQWRIMEMSTYWIDLSNTLGQLIDFDDSSYLKDDSLMNIFCFSFSWGSDIIENYILLWSNEKNSYYQLGNCCCIRECVNLLQIGYISFAAVLISGTMIDNRSQFHEGSGNSHKNEGDDSFIKSKQTKAKKKSEGFGSFESIASIWKQSNNSQKYQRNRYYEPKGKQQFNFESMFEHRNKNFNNAKENNPPKQTYDSDDDDRTDWVCDQAQNTKPETVEHFGVPSIYVSPENERLIQNQNPKKERKNDGFHHNSNRGHDNNRNLDRNLQDYMSRKNNQHDQRYKNTNSNNYDNYNNNRGQNRYQRERQEPKQRIQSFEEKQLPTQQGRVNPNSLSSINQTNLNDKAVLDILQSKDQANFEQDDSWVSKDNILKDIQESVINITTAEQPQQPPQITQNIAQNRMRKKVKSEKEDQEIKEEPQIIDYQKKLEELKLTYPYQFRNFALSFSVTNVFQVKIKCIRLNLFKYEIEMKDLDNWKIGSFDSKMTEEQIKFVKEIPKYVQIQSTVKKILPYYYEQGNQIEWDIGRIKVPFKIQDFSQNEESKMDKSVQNDKPISKTQDLDCITTTTLTLQCFNQMCLKKNKVELEESTKSASFSCYNCCELIGIKFNPVIIRN